jgi:hypothetical protein
VDPRAEDGNGPVTAVFGVGVFLAFLLFAVQVMLHLYGTSTVSAAAFDGARLMAAEDGVSCAAAGSHVRDVLGAYGARVSVSCPVQTADTVAIRVVGPSPAPLVDGFLAGFDLGDIERTARVRVETFRPGG